MIASCPRIESIDYSIELEIEDPYIPLKPWNEISGTAISPKQVGPSGFPVLFGHNDGPDSRLVFAAWDSGTGQRLKTINIELDSDLPLFHEDWEDMTIGNCGQDSSDTCIYIADTGDNRAQGSGAKTQRPSARPYTIYKIKEPQISQIQDNVVLSAQDHVSILQIDYKHFTSPTTYANCEAIFIDHTGWGQAGSIGDIYLVTKWNQPRSNKLNRLYKIPSSVWPKGYGEEGQYSPGVVGEYADYSLGSFYNFTWTGGDMSLDGSKIALTWKFQTHIFARCPGETVAEALAGQDIYSCVDYINPDEGANPGRQYEAVSFSPDGQKMFNLAESLAPPKIIHVDLDYTTSQAAASSVCSTYPTNKPASKPTPSPTKQPTPSPTKQPTPNPTKQPTPSPTTQPSLPPSRQPSVGPSASPTTATPSVQPTRTPTWMPSSTLTRTPTLGTLGVPSARIPASYGVELGPGTELVFLVTMVVFALW